MGVKFKMDCRLRLAALVDRIICYTPSYQHINNAMTFFCRRYFI